MQINKRIALSFLTIVVTLTAVVGVTLAAFTDSVNLTSNTLSTGNGDLRIGNPSEGVCGAVSGSSLSGISSSDLVPNQTSDPKEFCLRNASDGAVNLAITAKAIVTPEANPSNQLPKENVTVQVTCEGNNSVNIPLYNTQNDADGGPSSSTIVTIPFGAVGSSIKCSITQTLANIGNDLADKTIHYNVTFDGVQ